MKDYLIAHSLSLIKECNPELEEEKLEIIKYGLLSIYLTVTKIFIILLIASCLNMVIEVLLFLMFYNIIRLFSFGLHATKSWICLLSSSIIFIGVPYLCLHVTLPVTVRAIIGSITIFFIFKNSPADTHKRPIIDRKRRFIYKSLSSLFSIIYAYCSIFVDNNFYANCFSFAPIVQCFIISPWIYQLFGLPYENYKTYTEKISMTDNRVIEGVMQ